MRAAARAAVSRLHRGYHARSADRRRIRRPTRLAARRRVCGFLRVRALQPYSSVSAPGASTIGQVLLSYRASLGTLAGIVIILFGLHFLGILRIHLFYSEARYSAAATEASFAGAYVMGLAFAFGWTPCIGPVLATVLTLAASESSLWSGVRLLFVYSLGLGIPFILAAIAIRPFLGFMKRFKRHFATLEKVMGLLLVVTGLLFVFGAQNWFSQWMIENFPALGKIESYVTPANLGSEILKQGTP